MRTAEEYLDGLRDGRDVYYRGERVADVVEHPELGIVSRHAALDFAFAEEHPELGVTEGSSTYYHLPRDGDDLRRRSALIEAATAYGKTLVLLVKEIGTDALFALHRVARGTTHEANVGAFYEHCRDRDLALAVAQTDVKGDRTKGPSAQADPDMYVRVVERRPDGVVVRGAKAHTSYTPQADELIVIPTRALAEGEEDWAIAFAVPVATPGVKLFCSDFLHADPDPWTRPVSARHKMVETLTVFDDVFVPTERIFLDGDTRRAGQLALTFVEYHRFTAVSYKLPAHRLSRRPRRRARRGERHPARRARARQADPPRRLRGDRPRPHPSRRRSLPGRRADRDRVSRPADDEPGQVDSSPAATSRRSSR